MAVSSLDHAVARARAELGAVEPPDALYLCATGSLFLAERLEDAREIPLAGVGGVPAAWRATALATGRLGSLRVWALDDPGAGAPAQLARGEPDPRWAPGFPCWLAAASGARVLVYVTAGCALPEAPHPLSRGALALFSDHVRFGDLNPLAGLGESELGPLFPDLTRLYDAELRRAALVRARELGARAGEAVAACSAGPALDTPAERRLFARLGADVLVQGAAAPLLAAGHAGLAVLAVAALTDDGRGEAHLDELVAASESLAPVLEDLCLGLADDVLGRARELAAERGA